MCISVRSSSKKRLLLYRAGLMVSCVMMFVLALPALSLAQTGGEQPTMKQVLGKDAPAGEDAEQTAVKKKPLTAPTDELGRETPRSTALGFLNAGRERDYERAAEYLDLHRLPKHLEPIDATEFARHLKVVLDRTLWVDLSLLSDDPKGHADDGLPNHRDYVGSIAADGRKIDILLQRIRISDGTYIWKFSNATVRHIPDLYAEHGFGHIGETLTQILPDFDILGLQIWQWVMLIGLFIIAYLVAFLPTWLIGILLRRSTLTQATPLAAFVTRPMRLLIAVLLLRSWIDVIHPSITTRAVMRGKTVLIIVATWAIVQIVRLIQEYWVRHLTRTGREHAIVLLRPAATAVKVIVIMIAILVWLDNIGFEITTLVAGLGIGGIAVALAAQKSMENLIGAITLYMAAPVRVGDFCRFGDKLGTVEEIGLRSTHIRTLDQTVVKIPNGDFAAMQLENFAERERYRFAPRIRLRYGTTPDQIRCILVELQRLLVAHPKVEPPPARARFVGFGEHSLDIDIFTYIKASDYSDFLEVSEDLNLRIMDIVRAAGSEYAIPEQNLHLGRMQQPDEASAQAAKLQVAQWRENDDLPLPNLSKEEIEQLKGTLQYPPGCAPKSDSD